MGTLGRVLRVLLMNALFCEASFDQEHLICKFRGSARRNKDECKYVCCVYMGTLGRVLRVLLMNALLCEASFDQEDLICKCLGGSC